MLQENLNFYRYVFLPRNLTRNNDAGREALEQACIEQ